MSVREYFNIIKIKDGVFQFIGKASLGPDFGKSSVEGKPGTIDDSFNRNESTTGGIQCSGKSEAPKDYLNDVKTGVGQRVYHSKTGELLEDNTPKPEV